MFQKKKTCGVCGYRFTPVKEEVYTAEEPRAFAECFSKPPTRFSAVDCPRCGCQIALAIRVPRVSLPTVQEQDKESEWIIDECDSTDETPSRSWIDFHCPKCDTEFGLEEGQYGWYMGNEIPYKYCPICGERLKTKNCEVAE